MIVRGDKSDCKRRQVIVCNDVDVNNKGDVRVRGAVQARKTPGLGLDSFD